MVLPPAPVLPQLVFGGLSVAASGPGSPVGPASSALPLVVVLTWYDYPADVNAGKALVNDLDLEVGGWVGCAGRVRVCLWVFASVVDSCVQCATSKSKSTGRRAGHAAASSPWPPPLLPADKGRQTSNGRG